MGVAGANKTLLEKQVTGRFGPRTTVRQPLFWSFTEEKRSELSLLRTGRALVCEGCHDRRPQTGRLKEQRLPSHSLGGWESEIEVSVGWRWAERVQVLSPWLVDRHLFPVCSQGPFSASVS